MSGLPFLLYDNALERGTLTTDVYDATSTAPVSGATVTDQSGTIANITDRLHWNLWRVSCDTSGAEATPRLTIELDLGSGGEEALDGLGIVGHNLSEVNGGSAGLRIAHSANGSVWSSVGGLGTFANNRTYLKRWDQAGIARRYWQIQWLTVDDEIANIGAMYLGKVLELPEAMSSGWDTLSLRPMMRDARSETGNYLGSVTSHVAQGLPLQFSRAGLAKTFFESTGTPSWDEFIRDYWSLGKPWFFSWDGDEISGSYTHPANGPSSEWFCFPGSRARHAAPYLSPTRRRLRFGFDVLAEDYA